MRNVKVVKEAIAAVNSVLHYYTDSKLSPELEAQLLEVLSKHKFELSQEYLEYARGYEDLVQKEL